MAAYRISDQTLTLEVAFEGYVRGESSGHPPVVATNSYSVEAGLYWQASPTRNPVVTGQFTALNRGVTAWAFGTVAQDPADFGTVTPITASTVIAGTATISAECTVMEEITDGAAQPTYGGAAASYDRPNERTLRVYPKLKEGGALTCSIAAGGFSADVSHTIDADEAVSLSNFEMYVWLNGGGNNSSQDAELKFNYHGMTVPAHTASASGVSLSVDGTVLTLNNSSTGQGGIYVIGQPTVTLDYGGVLRTDAYAYPGTATIRAVTNNVDVYTEWPYSAGQYGGTETIEQYSVGGSINGTAIAGTAVERWTPTFWNWLVPPSTEDASEWRLMWRCFNYAVGEVAQATTVTVDGEFTVPVAGTVLEYDPAKSFRGYRYLVADVGVAGSAVSMTIGSKEWTETSNASGLCIYDLCAPHNLGTDVDAKTYLWPDPPNVDTVTADGCMWGVEQVGSVMFAVAAGSVAVGANGLYLSRDTWTDTPVGHSKVNIVPAFGRWAEDALKDVRPFGRGDTDGRRSLDTYDLEKVGSSYYETDIQDWFDLVNDPTDSGWSGTLDANVDVADGSAGTDMLWNHLNRNRPATWIAGAGIRYDDDEWSYMLDQGCESARELYAQVLADKVTLYPMCGDVFGLSAEEVGQGTIILRSGRYLRGVTWGLVFDTASNPLDGILVEYNRVSDGFDGGDGISDKRGEYLTGLNAGFSGYNWRAQAYVGASPFPYADEAVYGGERTRRCFAGTVGTDWISYDISDTQKHVRAYTDAHKLVFGRASDVLGATWHDITTDVDAEHPCVRWDNQDPHMRCVVDYDYEGNVYTTWTRTDAQEFADVTTLGTGKFPTMCVTRDGRHLHYWYENDAIKGVWLNALGGTVVAPFTAIASGVDEDAIDVKDYALSGNLWTINLTYRSGGSIVIKRSTDGITFS